MIGAWFLVQFGNHDMNGACSSESGNQWDLMSISNTNE
jgi:hypothetical protein